MRNLQYHIWRNGLKTYCGRHVTAGRLITKADYLHDPDDRPFVCYRCQNLVTKENLK